MMRFLATATAFAVAVIVAAPVQAEPIIWGVQIEQLEHRFGDDTDVQAWDGDAVIGTDELKFVWRSEGEYETDANAFESLENQIRLQTPISPFFDAVAGVRFDTPAGADRTYGVIGIHGLTKQWFEIDADLFVSDKPSARFEIEYEGLITNRVILTPSIELDVPLVDDPAIEAGAFGPKLELGLRLSYDLIDRSVAPYVGLHYERVFGETEDIKVAEGEDQDSFFLATGIRLMF